MVIHITSVKEHIQLFAMSNPELLTIDYRRDRLTGVFN